MQTENKTSVRVTVEVVSDLLHQLADTADARTAGDITSFWRHAEAALRLEADLARLSQVARSHQTLRPLAGRIKVAHDAVRRGVGPPSLYAPDSDAADQRPPMRDSTRRWLLKRDGQRRVAARLDEYRARCRAAGLAGQPKPLIGGLDQITRQYDRLPEQARALADELAAAAEQLPTARLRAGKRGRKAFDPDGTKKTVGDWKAFRKGTPGSTYADFIGARRLDMTVTELKRALARDRKAKGQSKAACGAPNPSSEI